jgi:hypothetical protein
MPARLSLLQTYGKFPQKKLGLTCLQQDAKWRLGGEIHGSKKGSTPEKEAAK